MRVFQISEVCDNPKNCTNACALSVSVAVFVCIWLRWNLISNGGMLFAEATFFYFSNLTEINSVYATPVYFPSFFTFLIYRVIFANRILPSLFFALFIINAGSSFLVTYSTWHRIKFENESLKNRSTHSFLKIFSRCFFVQCFNRRYGISFSARLWEFFSKFTTMTFYFRRCYTAK